MKKKTLIYLIALLLIHFSCNSSTALKRYGVITSDTSYAASIDTTHGQVSPITIAIKQFELKNQSTDHKIVFVCKCTRVDNKGNVFGNTEEHAVGPQEIVKLNRDSIYYSRIVKYEVVGAYLATGASGDKLGN
jgi:hypothetical protein